MRLWIVRLRLSTANLDSIISPSWRTLSETKRPSFSNNLYNVGFKLNSFFKDLITELENALTKEVLDELLLDFTNEFPPTQVYKGNCSAQEYLNQTAIEDSTGEVRTNREQTLEELIMLHLANENPAFKPFKLLFDDENLAKKSSYQKSWAVIKTFSKSQPVYGPYDHDLITLLKEPVMFAPESLKGQLEYIQKHWGTWLGEWVKRIFVGMDTISEEEKAELRAKL